MLLGLLMKSFPFEPSSGLIDFGLDIMPWIYLIGLIVIVVLLFLSKEKLVSMKFFIVPSGVTLLVIMLDTVLYYCGKQGEISGILMMIIIAIIGPFLLLLFIISSISGIIETIFKKLSLRLLAISILAFFCSFCFYIILVMFAFSVNTP